MKNRDFIKIFLVLTFIVIFSLNFYRFSYSFWNFTNYRFSDPNILSNEYTDGWILSKIDKELQIHIKQRNRQFQNLKKSIQIQDNQMKISPLNTDYIKRLKQSHVHQYPYSKWKCSNTSNTDLVNSGEYCIVSNIYYDSLNDQYYFYADPLDKNIRTRFRAPHHTIEFSLIKDLNFFQNFSLSAILTRPLHVSAALDDNYAHGFLETSSAQFWTLAECQYHASYINPSKIQIYLTRPLLEPGAGNWNFYKKKSDGTCEPTRDWEIAIRSMASIYPLLTYNSFNKTNVLFKYMIFPGEKMSRSASWGYNYPTRKYRSYPMPTQNYRRAYLAYSEWILYNFNLLSKFQLTNIQKQVQAKKVIEQIPICTKNCEKKHDDKISIDNFTGEWIVVLNRAGVGRREMTNADELVKGLLDAFPDQSNPHLRVWPKQFDFSRNFYQSVRMARSIRLLIGVHGAGLSNTIFMRPGAILLEVNPYGCQYLSFNFQRWAQVFNLQHALYVPTVGEDGRQDENCEREGRTTVNVKDVVDEVKNLLKNEIEYRTGYYKRALNIINDLSIVDYPPKGYEKILS